MTQDVKMWNHIYIYIYISISQNHKKIGLRDKVTQPYSFYDYFSKLCTEVIKEDVLCWNAEAIEHIHH